MCRTSYALKLHIGRRLREARKAQGLTQQRLASFLSLSFQQLQKYESGKNEITATRLYDLANLLFVPLNYFYDGFEGGTPVTHEMIAAKPEEAAFLRRFRKLPTVFKTAVITLTIQLSQRKDAPHAQARPAKSHE